MQKILKDSVPLPLSVTFSNISENISGSDEIVDVIEVYNYLTISEVIRKVTDNIRKHVINVREQQLDDQIDQLFS